MIKDRREGIEKGDGLKKRHTKTSQQKKKEKFGPL